MPIELLSINVKREFWQDAPFWLALSLGPVCWYLLHLLFLPLRQAPTAWQSLFWIALVYPVLEEYVFRAGIQSTLYRRTVMSKAFAGVSIANMITSMLFAAMHLINQTPLWAALAFFPSLVFGWARDRYGNIHASVALHITYNAGFVVLF